MANQSLWYGVIGALVMVLAGIGGYLYLTSATVTPTPTPTANVTLDLYAGEVNASAFGFGNSSGTITSPGPSFNVSVGDVVTVNFHNVGMMYHAFAVVNSLGTGYAVLFNSAIGSASNPIAPNGTATVTFTCTQAGSFYYICTVPGHVQLGMWGNFTVS
jgi:nitrite reductase (NO-forming)